jgi:dihydrofolate synthase/folylpolyglutamate synthase
VARDAGPVVIVDGAHNGAGAKALGEAVRALLPDRRVLALVAVMRDKRTDDILKEIRGFASGAVFTETSNSRSLRADDLADAWSRISGAQAARGEVLATQPDPVAAYREALRIASGEDGGYNALVVCGSLYLVSDLMDEVL